MRLHAPYTLDPRVGNVAHVARVACAGGHLQPPALGQKFCNTSQMTWLQPGLQIIEKKGFFDWDLEGF